MKWTIWILVWTLISTCIFLYGFAHKTKHRSTTYNIIVGTLALPSLVLAAIVGIAGSIDEELNGKSGILFFVLRVLIRVPQYIIMYPVLGLAWTYEKLFIK